jgi:hydrophobe/amphiphile efflux-3 (HAE3) family protein
MKSTGSKLLRELRRVGRVGGDAVEKAALAVARFSVGRARLVILAVALASVALGLLALRLDPNAGIGSLLDRGSREGKATESFHRQFGDEPITILVRARRHTAACGASCHLPDILLTPDLLRIVGLEGCISGNVPRGGKPQAPACAELAKSKPIKFVLGPGTFINESARQISGLFQAQLGQKAVQERRAEEAARKIASARGLSAADQERLAKQARQLVDLEFQRKSIELGLRYGLTTTPALNNAEFVLKLVFEPTLGAAAPKPRFAYLFPNDHSALIQARLRPGLGPKGRDAAIHLVRKAVASPRFRLDRGEYVVSGLPVVTQGVASSISNALWMSLAAVIALGGVSLALFSRYRPRSLPLLLALAAASLTFGAMSLLGTSLTIATVAVLPILVGLGTAHAVRFQARYWEALAEAPEGSREARREAATQTMLTTAIATGLTAIGFLVTLLSPVPMVRSFAAFMLLGLGLFLACTWTAGVAVLAGGLRGWRPTALPGGAAAGRVASRIAAVRAPRRLESPARASLEAAVRRPGRVLGIALVVALLGWVAGSQVDVQSGISQLAAPGGQQIKDAKALERETRSSGDVNVVVRAEDLTSPRVVAWMVDYQKRVLSNHGYSDKRPCRLADLCPALSLTNLLGPGRGQRAAQIRAAFAALPRYFSRSVISRDGRTATMSFGIRAMSPDRQESVIRDMRAELHPPAGVRAELAGIPVMTAQASSDLGSSRLTLTLAALALVFLALLAILRTASVSLANLITLAMAVGWAGLIRLVLGIPVNPLSAALGALLVAVLAQFGLALSARYLERRGAGLAGGEALRVAYGGAATVVLPAVAAVSGFLALAASNVRMLRDFGLLAAVDLTVCLIGLMVVLPAACVWLEERRPVRLPRSRAEAAAMARAARTKALAAAADAVRLSRAIARRSLRATRVAAAALARRVRTPRRRDEAQRP